MHKEEHYHEEEHCHDPDLWLLRYREEQIHHEKQIHHEQQIHHEEEYCRYCHGC